MDRIWAGWRSSYITGLASEADGEEGEDGCVFCALIATDDEEALILERTDTTFTVISTGTQPLGYQWKFNGGNILGATANSYTRSNAQTTDAGNYVVLITNVAGAGKSHELSPFCLGRSFPTWMKSV